ncbi:MAG: outer membrane beta-barrel protein [Bacteroidales bacterium]|nr:outer membrane beta-barrel protein [Bacteroidales bacterium]
MNNDFNYIDEFYKNSLSDYKEEAGKGVWENLRWTLFWMKYKWFISLSSIVLMIGASSLGFYSLSKSTDTSSKLANDADHKSEVMLAYNVENENNVLYAIESSAELELVISDDQHAERSSLAGIGIRSFEAGIEDAYDQVQLDDSRNSETTRIEHALTLSGMASQPMNIDLTLNPDSLLMGANRYVEPIPTSMKDRWFSINVYGGPSFSDAHISGVNSEYIDFRKANESASPGWSLGTDLRFHVKNWVFTTGINYAIYSQKRSYQFHYQEYSPEDSYYHYDTTWVWLFDPPDFGIPIISGIDSSWVKVYQDKIRDHSGQNQVRYFEIPLLVGYSTSTSRMTIELNAGASVGFLTYSKISIPDLYHYNEMVEAKEVNKTMVNFVANASLYYHLSNRVSIYASPYYKQNLQSVFTNTYQQKQRFNTFGINFGVNLMF